MIDPAHHKMVCQISFQPHTFFPSIISEDLTHRTILFSRVNGCRAGCQPPECKMIKFPVSFRAQVGNIFDILSLRQHLSADIINARHILSGKSPEKMSQTGTAPRMLIIVLDQMADILHTMFPAPAADLL